MFDEGHKYFLFLLHYIVLFLICFGNLLQYGGKSKSKFPHQYIVSPQFALYCKQCKMTNEKSIIAFILFNSTISIDNV